VGSYAVGKSVGIARKAELVVAPTPGKLSTDWPTERLLEALVLIANDIEQKEKPKDSTVVNMSFGVKKRAQMDEYWIIMGKNNVLAPAWTIQSPCHNHIARRITNRFSALLMEAITAKYGTVWVASAGNSPSGTTAGDLDTYPALHGQYLDSLIVVGASQRDGSYWPRSKGRLQADIYAPGAGLPWPAGVNLGALPPEMADNWQDLAGTSLGKSLFPLRDQVKTYNSQMLTLIS
jgi:hypothetical protein